MRRHQIKHKKTNGLPPTVLAKRRSWWEDRGFRFRPWTSIGKEKEQGRHSEIELNCGEPARSSNQYFNTASSSVPHTVSENVLSSEGLPLEEVNNGTVSPTQVFETSAGHMELLDGEETISVADPFTRMDFGSLTGCVPGRNFSKALRQ